MDITTKTSLVGLLLTLSALNMPVASASTTPLTEPTIEARLTRLSAALRERADQLPDALTPEQKVAIGWADGGGRDWANGRGRGWADGSGCDWANTRGGGWADGHGGGWVNHGGSWVNGGGGGSWYNRGAVWANRGASWANRAGSGGSWVNRRGW